jgi:transcriptional regulator with GAF, ATPase, and Fis domain
MTRLETLRDLHRVAESDLVEKALESSRWSLTAAAAWLGCPKSTLQTLIKLHGLSDVYAAHAQPKGRPRKDPV